MSRNPVLTLVAAIGAGTILALGAVGVVKAEHPASRTIIVHRASRAETVYIRNLAPQYISDKRIRREIPAWQHAVNADFARYGWFNEVSDPVEADSYLVDGVKISDFVTPAWFNDSPGSRYDFMGLCQQPFWLRPGGYAQFLDSNGWQILTNFRSGVATDRGFFDGDRRRR